MRLATTGYWAAATHQLRHLVECELLFELFRLVPEEAVNWRRVAGWDWYNTYKESKVRKTLRGLRGEPSFDLKPIFNMASNAGSHPSGDTVAGQMSEAGKFLGPLPHADRFKLYVAELWANMTRSTLEFIRVVDAPSDQAKVRERFPSERIPVDFAVDQLASLDAEQIRAQWI